MATADISEALRVPGRLIKNPTDLTAARPGGGTDLGEVADIVFLVGQKHGVIVAEEFGGQVVEDVMAGESAVLTAVLRQFDEDALGSVFPNAAAGSVTGKRKIEYAPGKTSGGYKLPGTMRSTLAFKLVFWPDDVLRHRFLVLYKAMPMVDESAKLQFHMNAEVGIPVVFQGIPDTANSYRTYDIGFRRDITL
jgi:hypothetical protein